MTAIEAALGGLIDYAGLYPPAALDMPAAVRNYLAYRERKHAFILGRFIVNISRLREMREAAGDGFGSMRLSVIAAQDLDTRLIWRHLDEGFRIESVEIKCNDAATAGSIAQRLPDAVERYFEIPMQDPAPEWSDALARIRARAKLRMGGVVAESFPSQEAVGFILRTLAERQLPFKATAGLHHPIRSRHPFTYAAASASGTMHGFLNVLFAAALMYFGGAAGEALKTLEEEDPGAWCVTPYAIRCRAFEWTADQLHEIRSRFFLSFGSCSFEEPTRDLEALGWL
ncbi:MAG: hypothetical protein WBE36_08885 [Terracidiphilus sp.]